MPTGIRLRVKARPGANRARGLRVVDLAEGLRAVEVTVAAAPEDGKANKAIAATIAKALGVKAAAVTLQSGATGKIKTFDIQGEPAALASLIEALP